MYCCREDGKVLTGNSVRSAQLNSMLTFTRTLIDFEPVVQLDFDWFERAVNWLENNELHAVTFKVQVQK